MRLEQVIVNYLGVMLNHIKACMSKHGLKVQNVHASAKVLPVHERKRGESFEGLPNVRRYASNTRRVVAPMTALRAIPLRARYAR